MFQIDMNMPHAMEQSLGITFGIFLGLGFVLGWLLGSEFSREKKK